MASLLTTQPERRTWWPVLAAFGGALVAHAVIVALLVLSSLFDAPKPPRQVKRPVTLRALSARQWASNRGPASRTALAAKDERPVPVPKGQIVDVAPGNDQKPVESKFIAETNNTVKQETRAKETTQKWSRATPKNNENPELAPSAKGALPKAPEPPPSGINLSESILGQKLRPTLLPDPPAVTGTGEPAEPTPEKVGTEGGDQARGAGVAEGGGAPNDALDGVAEGESTALNTREWKFAGFFNRVKQAVSAKWDPNGRLKNRRGLGAATRVTVMHVALKPDGSLADLFVAQSSGLDQLDAEAMMAFQKAAPFPNPPAALVENGYIRFAFSFQVSDGNLSVPSPFRFR
ncbi:MAG: TonB family protein [Archangium sp.]|nr:TonB family protein [Archangium sp.]